MTGFKNSLRWKKENNVVPTSESNQKLITFTRNDHIDMIKFQCTSPHWILVPKTSIIHESRLRKFDKILLVHLSQLHIKQMFARLLFEIRRTSEELLLGLIQVNFTPNSFKLDRYPIWFFTHWDLDSKTTTYTPQENKAPSLESMVES